MLQGHCGHRPWMQQLARAFSSTSSSAWEKIRPDPTNERSLDAFRDSSGCRKQWDGSSNLYSNPQGPTISNGLQP